MLEIRGLKKTFGKVAAVDGVDLSVKQGTIHGLIGPNGSGKSTTMNLISGHYRPTEGTVTFEGEVINGLPTHQLARRGLIRTFQLTRVFSTLTVLEAVRIGALAQRGGLFHLSRWLPFRSNDPATQEADEAIRRMGLEAHRDRITGVLPGGLQRILSITCALAAGPRMLLLDEPLAGLNATEKAEVSNRIKQLQADGISILLVEHDVGSIMRLSDHITVINFGKVIGTGLPSEISRNEDVIAAYLGNRRVHHAAG